MKVNNVPPEPHIVQAFEPGTEFMDPVTTTKTTQYPIVKAERSTLFPALMVKKNTRFSRLTKALSQGGRRVGRGSLTFARRSAPVIKRGAIAAGTTGARAYKEIGSRALTGLSPTELEEFNKLKTLVKPGLYKEGVHITRPEYQRYRYLLSKRQIAANRGTRLASRIGSLIATDTYAERELERQAVQRAKLERRLTLATAPYRLRRPSTGLKLYGSRESRKRSRRKPGGFRYESDAEDFKLALERRRGFQAEASPALSRTGR